MLRPQDVDLLPLRKRLIQVAEAVRGTVPDDERRQITLSLIIGRLVDCLHFMEIALKRVDQEGRVSLEWAERTGGFLEDITPEQALDLDPQTKAILNEAQVAYRQLRFEMETFFLWSSIFLSKLVQFLGSFMSHGKLRGVGVKSHNTFWPTVTKNTASFPFFRADLIEIAGWLGKNVIDYRDYYVAHTNNTENRDQFLIKAIVFQRMEPPRPVIVSFKAYEAKHFQSMSLEQIVPTVVEYTNRILDMVEAEARDQAALQTPPAEDISQLFPEASEPADG